MIDVAKYRQHMLLFAPLFFPFSFPFYSFQMHVHGQWFREPKTNRTVLFRGVNVGGGTKVPPSIPSHEPAGYWQDYDRKVTFVGRPFPLEEADMHLQRLVDHGFNLLRFMVTWEAIEHEGP